MKKYIAIVVLVILFAWFMTIGKAHASEPNPECLLHMAPAVSFLQAEHPKAGSTLLRYIVLTSDEYGGAGRWVLMSMLGMLDVGEAMGRPLGRPEALRYLAYLCSVPPQVIEKMSGDRWDLHQEHKDI